MRVAETGAGAAARAEGSSVAPARQATEALASCGERLTSPPSRAYDARSGPSPVRGSLMEADRVGESGLGGLAGLDPRPRGVGGAAPAAVSAERDEERDVLELYKLAVEMADRVSARRGTANAFFLSVQTALVSLVGFGMPELAESPWWVSLVMAMGGVTLSSAWWMQLRSYRHLNSAKFTVINTLEGRLPVRIFTDEWDVLKGAPAPGRLKRYAELGTSERVVPLVFALAHLALLAGTLSL